MRQQKIDVVDYGMGNTSLETFGSQSNQTNMTILMFDHKNSREH